MMLDSITCRDCGVKLASNARGDLCPRCLMGAALSATATHPGRQPKREAGAKPRVTFEELRRAILELSLIDPARLERLATDANADAAALARSLVQARELTPYQAGALLQGKGRGLIIGRHIVLDALGAGGMGVVLKARHIPTKRIVALKLLPPSFGRDPAAVERFRREFQVAARLNHPNIVAAIEAAEDRGVHFLTMEYVAGHNLEDVVASGGPLPIRLALHCIIQAAGGLAAAHEQGIIHRDIKPANLMLDERGAVRVLDLGLARIIEQNSALGQSVRGSLTQSGAYMGTVDFLAPEQADDAKKADDRSDVYSLGCTLYYLLIGRPPFPGDTMLKKLMAHQERPAPWLRDVRPEVPEELDAAYQKMMAKRPADRPQSMNDVIAALRACHETVAESTEPGVDLKTFTRNVMKRAEPKGKIRDTSVFARTPQPNGLQIGPDVDLEDLVSDYRDETGQEALSEEKLPPRPVRIKSSPHRARRRAAWPLFSVAASTVLILVGVVFARRNTLQANDPAQPAVAANEAETKPPAREKLAPASNAVTTERNVPAKTSAVLFTDEFNDPSSGWPSETGEQQGRHAEEHHGYVKGAYQLDANAGSAEKPGVFAWNCPKGPFDDFTCEVRCRAFGDNPLSRGALFIAATGATSSLSTRLFASGEIEIVVNDAAGALKFRVGRFAHPAIKRGPNDINVLKLSMSKRAAVVLINGVAVTAPVRLDAGTLPATLKLGVLSTSPNVRVQFERIEVRRPSASETAALDSTTKPSPETLTFGKTLYVDEFNNPNSGWDRKPWDMGRGAKPNLRDYENGIYYLLAQENWQGSWATGNLTNLIKNDFETEVVGRILGDFPQVPGGWGVIIGRGDARGIHVFIDRAGVLRVIPSFWGVKKFPNDGSLGPIKHAAINPSDQFNTLTVRVRGRRVEVLVNHAPVLGPATLDYDLLPAAGSLVLSKPDLNVRIRTEFDRVQVRELR